MVLTHGCPLHNWYPLGAHGQHHPRQQLSLILSGLLRHSIIDCIRPCNAALSGVHLGKHDTVLQTSPTDPVCTAHLCDLEAPEYPGSCKSAADWVGKSKLHQRQKLQLVRYGRQCHRNASSCPSSTLLCTHLSASAKGALSSSNLRWRQAASCSNSSRKHAQCVVVVEVGHITACQLVSCLLSCPSGVSARFCKCTAADCCCGFVQPPCMQSALGKQFRGWRPA